MSQATIAEIEAIAQEDRSVHVSRVARILGRTVFWVLLGLIVLTAIPYATSHVWWKAAFVSIVFILAMLWLVEGLISNSWFRDSWPMVLPLAALATFALLQTVPFGKQGINSAGISFAPWNAISADPYQTRFFALQLLALTLAGVFLFSYVSS